MQSQDSIKNEYFGHDHLTVISPEKGLFDLDLRELWAYRELFLVLVTRDIKIRYKQTVLGIAWAVIQPVTTMIIFSMVFGRFAKIPSDGFPYPVFVFAALLPWGLFSTAVSTAGNSMVGSAHLVSKVYFPRVLIPISSVGASLVDFLISTAILFLLMLVFSISFSPMLLLLPFLSLVLIANALGVGIFLSALTVSYRDFRYVIPFIIQIWMYLTPVIYPLSLIPEKWRWLSYLNPMTGIIEGFRAIFLDTSMNLVALLFSIIFASVMLCLSVIYFKRVEKRFADVI